MSEPEQPPRWGSVRTLLIGCALLALVLGGAIVARMVSPSRPGVSRKEAPAQAPRPIVQIVRQQPGLPDLSDLVDRTCPAIAAVVARSDRGAVPAKSAAGFAYSADGWIVAEAGALPDGPLDALFSDGTRASITETRTDPVTGLVVLKSTASPVALDFTDQPFPRVGQFGIPLTAPAGHGCSATTSMIGSDFLADGGGPIGYVRLRPTPDTWATGTPIIGSDGRVLAVEVSGEPGAAIPAALAAIVVDELVRDTPSSSVGYGFRTIDFAGPIAGRIGDVRTGAAVAFVEDGSSAQKAGLRAGDIITTVNDQPVSGASELSRLLDGAKSQVTLGGRRQSDTFEIRVRATKV